MMVNCQTAAPAFKKHPWMIVRMRCASLFAPSDAEVHTLQTKMTVGNSKIVHASRWHIPRAFATKMTNGGCKDSSRAAACSWLTGRNMDWLGSNARAVEV